MDVNKFHLIFLVFLTTFFLLPSLSYGVTTFILKLKFFENNTVIVEKIGITEGKETSSSPFPTSYTIEILSFNNSLLARRNIPISFWFDGIKVDRITTILYLPYFKEAKWFIFFHEDKVIKKINLTDFLCNLNNLCEIEYGESPFICRDCSGKSDGICDQQLDKICDLDCSKENDWDCHCGDGECEEHLNETEYSCSDDCGCNLNKICEINRNENYLSCEDCISGSKDNYCDKLKDGICDPDCKDGEDVDCNVTFNLLIILASIIILLTTLIIFSIFLIRRKKEKEWEKLKEKWIKKEV